MNKQEMLNEIKSRQLSTAEVMDKIAVEKRELTNVEKVTLDNYKIEIKDFEERIKLDAEAKPKMIVGVDRTENTFRLLKAVRDITNGNRFDERSMEMIARGQKSFNEANLGYRGQIQLPWETRATPVLAGTLGQGGYTVDTDYLDLIGALRGALVAVKAGATVMTGLKNNIAIPVYSGSTAAWATSENASAAEGIGGSPFTQVTLSPYRLTTYIDVSKQFIAQDSTSSEQLLMQDLTLAIMNKLEDTIFDATASGSGRPAGILYGMSDTYSGATTWASVVKLETTVETANALTKNLAYIGTPALRGVMKTMMKNATYGSTPIIDATAGIGYANSSVSNGYVYEGVINTANGYPFYSTSHMNSGNLIYGNWADLLIANWSGLDITELSD